jgi:membrane-bound metal-dependent hydrolase YbcI (DUF457 family)
MMPLPVAHGLIGASIVAASREELSLRKDGAAMLAGACVAIAPDLDLAFSWLLGYGLQTHAGVSHSIAFAALLGLLAAALLREARLKSFLVYSTAALSHGILDAATKREFGGAALLWPLSDEKFRLGLGEYFAFYPHPRAEPIGPILERALEICNYEMAIFMPIFILTVWGRRWHDQMRHQHAVRVTKIAIGASR